MVYQAERATLLTMLDEKESQKFSTQTMVDQFEKVYRASEQLQNSILEKCRDYS